MTGWDRDAWQPGQADPFAAEDDLAPYTAADDRARWHLTGPEHYAAGERLLAASQRRARLGGGRHPDADLWAAQARDHLLAAQVALEVERLGESGGYRQWAEATR